MSEDSVLLNASPGGVATITLNRPEVHNAFDEHVVERLNDILDELAGADGVRAVLLDAVGKSFSAGADLDLMRRAAEDFTEDDNLEDARAMGEMWRRLATLPKPTIALVQGAAYGGGVGLIAACDIAIATKDAFFSLSEVKLGLIPSTIAPYFIQAVGVRHARRYMMTGERFGAIEARRIGLVHEVVDDVPGLASAAEAIVTQIFAAAPGAVAETKALVSDVVGRPIDHHLIEHRAKGIAHRRATDEAREGVAAFLAKRKPAWRD